MKTIDIHIHGVGGYDTRTDSEDDIFKIAEILGSRGVSEIMPTIYPSSINEMRRNMIAGRKAMERALFMRYMCNQGVCKELNYNLLKKLVNSENLP